MYVLDASALLAFLNDEPGGTEVTSFLDDALISTVNLAEVLQKASQAGIDITRLASEISGMGVHAVPFDASMAATSASLWDDTRKLGLSLADRACLSLAAETNAIAVTADRAWAKLDLPEVNIHLVDR